MHDGSAFDRRRCCRFFLDVLSLCNCSIVALSGNFLEIIHSTGMGASPKVVTSDSHPNMNSRLIAQVMPLRGIPTHSLTPLLHRVVSTNDINGIIRCRPSGILVLANHTSAVGGLVRIVGHISIVNARGRRVVRLRCTSTRSLTRVLGRLVDRDRNGDRVPTLLSTGVITSGQAGSLVVDKPRGTHRHVASLLGDLSIRRDRRKGAQICCLGCTGTAGLIRILANISRGLGSRGKGTHGPSSSNTVSGITVATSRRAGSLIVATSRSIRRGLTAMVTHLSVHHTRILIRTVVIRIRSKGKLGLNIR